MNVKVKYVTKECPTPTGVLCTNPIVMFNRSHRRLVIMGDDIHLVIHDIIRYDVLVIEE